VGGPGGILTHLLWARDGNIYGVTGNSTTAAGTVFKLTPDGTLTILVACCTNVYGPDCLLQASDGNFYGTTEAGGTLGVGTIFKVTPDGTLTTIVSFSDTNATGIYGEYSLMQASDGNFYGTMYSGGRYTSTFGGYPGTVFRVSPNGVFTNLAYFNDVNGAEPTGPLVEGTDGNFYGATQEGGTLGSPPDPYGIGTLFKMTPQGRLTTLFRFSTSGYSPGLDAGLVQAGDGSFYGTTLQGGVDGQEGTTFRLTVPGADTPKIVSTDSFGGSFTLHWLALRGRSYQLQFTTDLAQTNWTNTGAVVTATNTTAAATDSLTPDPQRFYRLVLLP
jgi:uncharacterized repeat protein (TIGR03803 family)